MILFQNNWTILFRGILQNLKAAALRIFTGFESVDVSLPDSIIGVKKSPILKNIGIYRWICSLKVLRPSNLYVQTKRLRNQRHHSQGRQVLNSESCQNEISVKAFSFLLLTPCTWLRQVMVRSRGVPAPKLHPRTQVTTAFGYPALRPPAHMIRLQSCSLLVHLFI